MRGQGGEPTGLGSLLLPSKSWNQIQSLDLAASIFTKLSLSAAPPRPHTHIATLSRLSIGQEIRLTLGTI